MTHTNWRGRFYDKYVILPTEPRMAMMELEDFIQAEIDKAREEEREQTIQDYRAYLKEANCETTKDK